jgi:hypothetical protein
MQKYVLAFCLAVSLCASSYAVQGAAPSKDAGSEVVPPDAASRAQIMTLFDLLQVRRTMASMAVNMKKAMAATMEQGLRSKVPNPTPKQLKQIQVMIDSAMDDVPIDELINALIPVYQRHFSKTDVDELIRFYASPVGQKYLREQPQMMQETRLPWKLRRKGWMK